MRGYAVTESSALLFWQHIVALFYTVLLHISLLQTGTTCLRPFLKKLEALVDDDEEESKTIQLLAPCDQSEADAPRTDQAFAHVGAFAVPLDGFQYGSFSDDTRALSKSVFVTNFPDSTSSKDLWTLCQGYGTVVDVYIPNRKSKAGKRFAFVRFIRVINLDRLINNLCTLWIGRMHLHANVVRFARPPKRTAYSIPTPANPGFKNVKLVYLGGLWVMIELESLQAKESFLQHIGVASWFSHLRNAQMDFVSRDRIVSVDLEGVPLHAWTRATFIRIGSKWGEVLELEE
nr:RNA-directed DNA polymerase, eukaryota, nucleotide-binding alpha-beta plait domain protein [Tanacetum cinerariifolium]